MAERPELTELARLPDLAEYVLEEVAPGVGVHLFEIQVVHRLVFEPGHAPLPRAEDGGVDAEQVTAIMIVEVADYH